MSVKLFNFVLLISLFLVDLSAFGQDSLDKDASKEQVVEKNTGIKNRLEEIEKEKKLLENEMLQKRDALKNYKKECRFVLEKQQSNKLGTIDAKFELADKRLETMEIKFEVNKLKKERDFLKKYERLGVRKTKINKLENLQKELSTEKDLVSKKLTGQDTEEQNKDLFKINKDLNKIKKELNNLEKISQKDYIKNRLIEIDGKLDVLSKRSLLLRDKLSEPKKHKESEIKTNLNKVEQEFKFEKVSFQETIADLEQEELLLKKKNKQLFS